MAIRVALQKPIFRKLERIRVKEDVKADVWCQSRCLTARISDLSGQGIRLELNEAFSLKTGRKVRLQIGTAEIPCEVVRSQGRLLALWFDNPAPEHMKCIMEIFCRNMEAHYKVEAAQDYYVESGTVEKAIPPAAGKPVGDGI